MGVFVIVAGGIFRVAHVERFIGVHLRLLSHNIPFTLLRDHTVNKRFFRFDVVPHPLHFVLVLAPP